ncbi:hypothetical protein [Saccharothrix lopnurensis]|uniref:Uncharacterized protein n=1 Tax=Saccharothrix lopnurensis TaxID=1670621 RepID=A0ABW1P5B9_9PSEU
MVAGLALAAVALGGPAGVAAAQEPVSPQVAAQELLPCAALDELESSLRELAATSDRGAVKDRVGPAFLALAFVPGIVRRDRLPGSTGLRVALLVVIAAAGALLVG